MIKVKVKAITNESENGKRGSKNEQSESGNKKVKVETLIVREKMEVENQIVK